MIFRWPLTQSMSCVSWVSLFVSLNSIYLMYFIRMKGMEGGEGRCISTKKSQFTSNLLQRANCKIRPVPLALTHTSACFLSRRSMPISLSFSLSRLSIISVVFVVISRTIFGHIFIVGVFVGTTCFVCSSSFLLFLLFY